MALTTTTLSAALTASGQQATLTAFTNPSTGGIGPLTLLKVDDEIMLITSAANSPTVSVVRGYMGTVAAAHTLYAGALYGLSTDFQASKGSTQAYPSMGNPQITYNTQVITSTGATGSTAAPITIPAPGLITTTGSSGTSINLPYPAAGAQYFVRNINTTGVCKVFSVGATINGTTGTTSFDMDTTGTDRTYFMSVVAGQWVTGPATT